jgi:hypothetical protein
MRAESPLAKDPAVHSTRVNRVRDIVMTNSMRLVTGRCGSSGSVQPRQHSIQNLPAATAPHEPSAVTNGAA